MTFSWKRIFKVVGIVVFVGLVAGGVYFIANLRPVRSSWAWMVHGRIEPELSCYDLPFYPHVQFILNKNSAVAAKVTAIPGVVSFTAENIHCENYEGNNYFIKGDLVLVYHSRAAAQQAEKIIGKDFFGIPYRGYPE